MQSISPDSGLCRKSKWKQISSFCHYCQCVCGMTVLLFLKGHLDTCYELFAFSQLWCGRAFICYAYPHPPSRNRNLTGLPLIISLFPCEYRLVYCFMLTLKPPHAFSWFQGNSRQQNKVENFVSSENSGTKDVLHCCSRPDECIHRISYIRVRRTFFAILTVTEGGEGCVAFLLKIQRCVSRPCCERVCYCLCDHRTVLMTWNIHSICFCFGLVLDLDTCVSGPPASSLLADPIHSLYFRMSEFLAMDINIGNIVVSFFFFNWHFW